MGSVALSLVVLATAIVLLLPDRYTATIVILPPQQGGMTGTSMLAQLSSMSAAASGGGMSIKNPNELQVALLKSRTVENAMVARFDLQHLYRRKYPSAARKRWERSTKIDSGLKDSLIHLAVTDQDPRRAAELANGWVEEYRHLSANLAMAEAAQRRLFYERLLNAAHGDLERSEEAMKQTEQRTGVIELDGQAHAMIASAAMLRARVAEKQVSIQAMRQYAADENPDLERARQELSSLEAQLAAMDVDSDRVGGDLVAPKGKLGEAGLEYARALREVKFREMVEQLLTRQYEAARIDEARQGPQAQVVDPALVPDRPNYTVKIAIGLAALVLSLPLAVLFAMGAEAGKRLRARRRSAGSWATTLADLLPEGAR